MNQLTNNKTDAGKRASIGRVTDSDQAIAEKLDRISDQLERIHIELSRANAPRTNPFTQAWRDAFRSRLFYFHHYDPRTLQFPATYTNEKLDRNAPAIAVATTNLNQAEFLRDTINSVLQQGYPKLSYFVKDAASTDGSIDLLTSFGDQLSWSSKPDNGQSSGLNEAFEQIDGEIMGYLNADDLLAPGALAYVARAFSANPHVDVVYGHRIVIDENGREIGRWVLPPHDSAAIRWADYIPQETMFWRRRVWDAIGPFDEKLQFALDWDFILKAERAGFRFKRLPRFLGCFRVHSQQKTTSLGEIGESECRALRKLHLGRDPSQGEIDKAIRPFVKRHVLYHRLYKFPLVRY